MSQEPILLDGSVAENIRFGRAGISDAQVVAAARAAHAHDFIKKLPEQYNTHVAEEGALR